MGGSGRAGGYRGPGTGLVLLFSKQSLGLWKSRLLPFTCCRACSVPGHVSYLLLDKLLIFPLSLFAPLCF